MFRDKIWESNGTQPVSRFFVFLEVFQRVLSCPIDWPSRMDSRNRTTKAAGGGLSEVHSSDSGLSDTVDYRRDGGGCELSIQMDWTKCSLRHVDPHGDHPECGRQRGIARRFRTWVT